MDCSISTRLHLYMYLGFFIYFIHFVEVNPLIVFCSQEFMKGGKELEELISDLLEHSEQEALLELVETSVRASGRPAD